MKRLALAIGVLGLLLLDWAALHDILAGETNVWMEWTILGLSVVAFGLLVWKARILRLQGREQSTEQ